LKRDNLRSIRLLQRLGFARAAESAAIACDEDEIAMLRAQ
jgi:RimJ/RimL family protein N-acetyltransferase